MKRETRIEKAYEIAREEYLEIGVDIGQAIDRLDSVPISIHCWQIDDMSGIEHIKKCREIGSFIGKELGSTCIHNNWIPDGSKDLTVNRYDHRSIHKASLDEILKIQ